VLNELRLIVRGLRRDLLVSATVVLVLGLGLGAATAVTPLARAVLFDGPPYPRSERLVVLTEAHESGLDGISPSYPNFLDWRRRSRSLSVMAAVLGSPSRLDLSQGDRPESLVGAFATGSYFELTGARAALGRLLEERDDHGDGGALPVVLGERLWQRGFGGDPGVLGQKVWIDGIEHTVVGVLSADHVPYPDPSVTPELWLAPRSAAYLLDRDFLDDRGRRSWRVLARLAEGADLEAAREEMGEIAVALGAAYPQANTGTRLEVTPLRKLYLEDLRTPVAALFVCASFLLVVGCGNVAALLLVRNAEQEGNDALRLALGAPPSRRLARRVTEVLLLSLGGGLMGLVVADLARRGLLGSLPVTLPPHVDPALQSGIVALCAVLAASAAVIIAAVLSTVTTLSAKAARGPLALVNSGKGLVKGASGGPVRGILVIGEVAVAMTLLIVAALVARSLIELRRDEIGYRPDRISAASLELSSAAAEVASLGALLERVSDAVRSLADVDAASYWGPTAPGVAYWYTQLRSEAVVEEAPELPLVRLHNVGPGALGMLGLPILAGREIDARDDQDAEPVIVLSASAATVLLANCDPIGQRLRRWNQETWYTVIGVVADARQGGRLGEGARNPSDVYFSYRQHRDPMAALLVRARAGATLEEATLEKAIRAVDPRLSIAESWTLDESLTREEAPLRFSTFVGAGFALVALLLSAIGLYGLLTFSVRQRTLEIGLRLALGAPPQQIVREVTWRGMRLVGVGALIGTAVAVLPARALESLLYGVESSDPLALAAVVVALVAVTLVACWLPARLAARVDPSLALRRDG
jgi:putative ABC transport system permease protein